MTANSPRRFLWREDLNTTADDGWRLCRMPNSDKCFGCAEYACVYHIRAIEEHNGRIAKTVKEVPEARGE